MVSAKQIETLAQWWYNVTKGVWHCYNGVTTGDAMWNNITNSHGKNDAFMFLTLLDNVHIKS